MQSEKVWGDTGSWKSTCSDLTTPWVLPDYTVFRPTTLRAEIEADCELEWQAFGQWNYHSKPLANGMAKGLEFTLAGSGLLLVTRVQAIPDKALKTRPTSPPPQKRISNYLSSLSESTNLTPGRVNLNEFYFILAHFVVLLLMLTLFDTLACSKFQERVCL